MIGVFNSGIEGLVFFRALKAALPDYDMIFLGDTLHMSYGNKSGDAIIRLSAEHITFLVEAGAKLIVLADFTVSAVAADALAHRLSVPVIDVVTPAAARAVCVSQKQLIGVIGSTAAVESGACERKIRVSMPTASVFSASVPLIGPLIENGWRSKPEFNRIVKKYLHPLKVRQVDTLILGCPYGGMIQNVLQQKIGRRVVLVDPSESAVSEVGRFLTRHSNLDLALQKNGAMTFYATDVTPSMERLSHVIFNQRVCFKRIRF